MWKLNSLEEETLELNVRPNPSSIPKIDSLPRRGGVGAEADTEVYVNNSKNIVQSRISVS
jgi:hypothetical protein